MLRRSPVCAPGPEAGGDHVRSRPVELLTAAGAPDETEALLTTNMNTDAKTNSDAGMDTDQLALVLILQGRPEEAIRVSHPQRGGGEVAQA